jgi:predicted Zn-dependent peptidase
MKTIQSVIKISYMYCKILITASTLIGFLLVSSNAFAQHPDRSKLPELPLPSPLNLPEVQKFELSNGLKVFLMEKHDVPLVQMNLIIKAGIVNDPGDKSGLASLTLDMMDEGAGDKDALQLADAIDFLGARISTNAGYHASRISLFTPYSKLNDALKLFAEIALHPTFPEKELARLKKERLTTLMQWHDEPNAIASVMFNKVLYGDDHPYGRPSLGNENSIKELSIDDLKKFHSGYFKPNNAYLIVVGSVKQSEVKQKLEKEFSKWKRAEVKQAKLTNARQVTDRVIYLVDKPGAAQSVISIGRIGVKRLTDDYNSIIVMNTILGGSFSSRLNQNLREQHGYTYGARSSFAFRDEAGPFSAGASVQTDVTDKALVEFFNELNAIRLPISAEELGKAKNYVALGYPENFQTISRIAIQLEEMLQYSLPENYFNNYMNDVLSVNAEQVHAAADKYIQPVQVAIIIVGDRQKIEQGVKDLNLGELKFYTIEDVLGKVPELTAE